jgi:hypothetical protein
MQAQSEFDISVDDYDEVVSEPLGLKLQSADAELNVRLSLADVAAILAGIPNGPNAHALEAGTSAGASVFWALGEHGELFIVAGRDDQTWDFGVTLTALDRERLLKELARVHEKGMRSNNALERTRNG